MEAHEIIDQYGIEHDRSGVGHAWERVDSDDVPADVAEEIAAWIVEDRPDLGDEMTASNGQAYRLPPVEGVSHTQQVSPPEQKHTPGPWMACPGDAHRHYQIECRRSGNGEHPIAVLKGPDRHANARLIASAPDLLAQRDRLAQLVVWAAGRVVLEHREGRPILGAWLEEAEKALVDVGIAWPEAAI